MKISEKTPNGLADQTDESTNHSQNTTSEAQASAAPASAPDPVKLALYERFTFESEMLHTNPEGKAIRLVGKPELLLQDFLQQAGIEVEPANVLSAYVVTDDWSGKSCHPISDFSAYQMLDDILCKDEDGDWSIQKLGANVMLHINYTSTQGEGYLCLHLAPWGKTGAETHLYTRVTLLHQHPGTDGTAIRKFLFSFDSEDQHEILDRFQTCREEGIRKLKNKEEITDDEAQALQHFPIAAYGEIASRKMASHCWSDAVTDWDKVFRYMNRGMVMNRIPEQARSYYFDATYNLGRCLFNKGLYVQALYYLEIVVTLTQNPEVTALFEECARRVAFVSVKHAAPAHEPQVHALGLILRTCFDITPADVSRLLWMDTESHENGKVESQQDIWQYNIWEAMRDHNELTLNLSYCSRVSAVDSNYDDPLVLASQADSKSRQKWEAGVDKSYIQLDNVVIIRLTKRQGIITLTGMVPGFKLESNNADYPKAITLTFREHPQLSRKQFQTLREAAMQKNAAQEQLTYTEMASLGHDGEAQYYFALGRKAAQDKYWGDCIFYLSKAYYRIAPQWYTNDLDEYDRNLFPEICFNLGFAYMEQRREIYAYHYLCILPPLGNINYTVEFINNLNSLHDIRAWGLIEEEMKALEGNTQYKDFSEEQKSQYATFLKRRKAYMLTEYQHFTSARKYLNELLEDPTCKEFAQHELEYLKKLGF